MSTGEQLAAARVAAGMSVEDVSRATRIRGQLIRELEADDLRSCGGAVYARGHMRSIGALLGMDVEPLLDDFERQHGGATTPKVREVFERETVDIPRRTGPNWTAVMAAFAGLALIAAVVTLFNSPPDAQTVADDVPNVLVSTSPTPGPQSSIAGAPEVRPSEVAALPTTQGVSVRVRVTRERSWVRATADDGRVLYQGVMEAGAVRDFAATRQLSLVIGNAGVVSLVVNGRDIGAPGAAGEVARVVFGPDDGGGQPA